VQLPRVVVAGKSKMIITNNEEALRIKCEDVREDEVSSLIFALENELNYANKLGKNGVGLAAPQIGIAKKAAIVRLGNGLNINLVNPSLEHGYDSKIFTQEGCLSFPGRLEDTSRFQEIVINNNSQKFIATGFLAVVCQHEIDHLYSVLFSDRKIIKPKPVLRNKIGPNEFCFCGSNKKFKKCCSRK